MAAQDNNSAAAAVSGFFKAIGGFFTSAFIICKTYGYGFSHVFTPQFSSTIFII